MATENPNGLFSIFVFHMLRIHSHECIKKTKNLFTLYSNPDTKKNISWEGLHPVTSIDRSAIVAAVQQDF